MLKQKRSIQSRIFLYSTFITVVILLLFTSIIYVISYRNITENIKTTQQNLHSQIKGSLTSEIESMNSISLNFIYSNMVKSNFDEYIKLEQSIANTDKTQRKYQKRQTIYDFVIAILGPNNMNNQINMYSLDGYHIGSGLISNSGMASLTDFPWYDEVLKNKGKATFTQFASSGKKEMVSLSRTFYNSNYTLDGIIEIQRPYDEFYKEIMDIEKSNPNYTLYIVDSNDQLLYPALDDSYTSKELIQLISQNEIEPNLPNVTFRDKFRQKKILYWDTIAKSNWKIIMVLNYQSMYKTLNDFTKAAIFMLLLSLCMTLTFSHLSAKKISTPIQLLSKELETVHIDNTGTFSSNIQLEDTSISEINTLYHGISIMEQKIHQSLSELLVAQKHELDAKSLAMQNLMGPHFLFNSLAAISAMAITEKKKDIPFFCQNLSSLLRYASSNLGHSVLLREEIEFALKYVYCMEIKFDHLIPCHIDIPTKLETVSLPKMTLQPLIENAFKYGMNSIDTFEITIEGEMVHEGWRLKIKDNGFGFDPLILDGINDAISSKSPVSFEKGIELGGMGICNIYLRLKQLYGDRLLFQIHSDESSGSEILIGVTYL